MHTRKSLFLLPFFALSIISLAHAEQVRGPSMLLGKRTTQPIGHFEFCKILPEECKDSGKTAAKEDPTQKEWAQLYAVNSDVNRMISASSDEKMHGKTELWSFPTTQGDCEDYALLKRKRLIELGFNPGNLLMTVVKKPDGEGHAVLTITTTSGDFVMDNLTDEIVRWDGIDYAFLKRQDQQNAGRWTAVLNGSDKPAEVADEKSDNDQKAGFSSTD